MFHIESSAIIEWKETLTAFLGFDLVRNWMDSVPRRCLEDDRNPFWSRDSYWRGRWEEEEERRKGGKEGCMEARFGFSSILTVKWSNSRDVLLKYRLLILCVRNFRVFLPEMLGNSRPFLKCLFLWCCFAYSFILILFINWFTFCGRRSRSVWSGRQIKDKQ